MCTNTRSRIYATLTCVVKDILDDVLNFLKRKVVLWSLACVPVYSRNWAALEVTSLDVFKPLLPDGVDEEEGTPAHTVTLVVEVCVRCLPVCRTRAVMTEECGGLEGVSHHLPYH